MFNYKGSVLISVPVTVLLILVAGVSYYLGTLNSLNFFAGSSESNSPSPSSSDKPKVLNSPAAKAKPTPLPAEASTPVSNNTADPNSPTAIKVLSPNGGENFKVGEAMHISWSSNNLTKSGSCVVTLVYDDGTKSTAWFPVNTPQGYDDWKLPAETEGKKAKINMECYDTNQTRVEDQSDNLFTVNN